MYTTRRTPVPESFACLFRQYSVAAACHTESMAVPLRLVLAKNPSQRGVYLPILRCPGLPYTKYGCAGAPRLGKKIQPTARRLFPILRCPGLPYTKYGCAGASRLGKKSSPRHGARSPYFAAAACHTQSTAVPGRRPFFTGRRDCRKSLSLRASAHTGVAIRF